MVLQETVSTVDEKLQKEKDLKFKAQKVASKWRRMDKTKMQKESKLVTKLHENVIELENENKTLRD